MIAQLPRHNTDAISPAVAAVIPAYDGGTIIESVASATLKQITNVIVVDDGSRDAAPGSEQTTLNSIAEKDQ